MSYLKELSMSFESYVARGDRFADAKKYELALSEYQAAFELDEDDVYKVQALRSVAHAKKMLGLFPAAEASLVRAIGLTKRGSFQNAILNRDLGELLLETPSRRQQAYERLLFSRRALFERGELLENAYAHALIGRHYQIDGDAHTAATHYWKALDYVRGRNEQYELQILLWLCEVSYVARLTKQRRIRALQQRF